jgi:hypothetical protein
MSKKELEESLKRAWQFIYDLDERLITLERIEKARRIRHKRILKDVDEQLKTFVKKNY